MSIWVVVALSFLAVDAVVIEGAAHASAAVVPAHGDKAMNEDEGHAHDPQRIHAREDKVMNEDESHAHDEQKIADEDEIEDEVAGEDDADVDVSELGGAEANQNSTQALKGNTLGMKYHMYGRWIRGKRVAKRYSFGKDANWRWNTHQIFACRDGRYIKMVLAVGGVQVMSRYTTYRGMSKNAIYQAFRSGKKVPGVSGGYYRLWVSWFRDHPALYGKWIRGGPKRAFRYRFGKYTVYYIRKSPKSKWLQMVMAKRSGDVRTRVGAKYAPYRGFARSQVWNCWRTGKPAYGNYNLKFVEGL